jgi:hypothetical protein
MHKGQIALQHPSYGGLRPPQASGPDFSRTPVFLPAALGPLGGDGASQNVVAA